MTTQPKHHWTFDENTGSVASDAVGSVNGTLSPKVIREAQGRIGSGAMHIDGSNDSFVTFGTSVGQFGINDFTVAFWLRTTETYKYFDLVGNRTAGSHGNFFCLRMTGRHESKPEGMVVAEVDQDGNNYIALESTKTGLNDGNWHHLAVARKGTSLKLYVDGALSAEGTASGVANISNGNEFKLGRSLVGVDDKFAPDAHYDDLRLYDVALPDEEIANLFTLSETENSTNLYSLGHYTIGNEKARKLIQKAVSGGSGTEDYFNFMLKNRKKVGDLVKHVSDNDERAWVDGKDRDGNPIRYANINDSYISLSTSPSLGKKALNTLAEQNVDVSKAKFSAGITIRIDSGEGLTLVQELAIIGLDLVITDKLIMPLLTKLVQKLTPLLTNVFRKGVNEGVDNARIEGENSTVEPLEIAEGLPPIEVKVSTSSKLLRFGKGFGSFAVSCAIAYVIGLLIEKVVLRKYIHYMDIINVTESDLEVSFPYLYNLQDADKSGDDARTLHAVQEGAEVKLPGVGDVTTEDILLAKAECLFSNKSEFLKGIGYLIKLAHPDGQDKNNLKNVIATIDIPRLEKNSIATWFNESSTDYESLFNSKDGVNKETKIEMNSGDYRSILTMSALSGADNNTYYSVLLVVNTKRYSNYIGLLDSQ